MSALGPHFILAIVAALLLLTTTTAQVDTAALAVDGVAPVKYGGKRCYSLIDGCDTCSRYMFPRDGGKTYGDGAKLASFNGGKYWKINTCQICKTGWSLFGDGDFYKFTKFPKYCIPPKECQGNPDDSLAMYSKGFMYCSDKKIDARCTAECKTGYTGGYIAICTKTNKGTEWAVTGDCKKVPVGKTCPPYPKPNPRPKGKPFVCTDTSIDAVCKAECEPPATGKGYEAKCYAPVKGKPRWKVTGECTEGPPPPTTPKCKAPPAKQPYGNDFKDCSIVPGSLPCSADCISGYLGGYLAECKYDSKTDSSEYAFTGTCVKVPPVTCPATPPVPTPQDDNFDKFDVCADLTLSAVCLGKCKPGSTGGYAAFCLPNSKWLVKGYCMPNQPTMPKCTGPPPIPTGSEPISSSPCISSTIGTACAYKCKFGLGGFIVACSPLAGGADWKTFGGCCTSLQTCSILGDGPGGGGGSF